MNFNYSEEEKVKQPLNVKYQPVREDAKPMKNQTT